LREVVARGLVAFHRELKKWGRGRKKEAPTHGATMSATAEKEKEMAGRWAVAGGDVGLPGRWGKVRGEVFFSFLFKPFSNSNFSKCFQNISNSFKTFETLNLHTEHYATKI
jgi:hypothetical protein